MIPTSNRPVRRGARRGFTGALATAAICVLCLLGGLLLQNARAAEPTSAQPRVDLYGDPLPLGAIARLGTNRFRHLDMLTGAAFSPDDKLLACSYVKGSVVLWEAATGKPVRELAGHKSPRYSAIAFSPDGKELFAGEADGWIAMWNVDSSQKAQFRTPNLHFAAGPVNLATVAKECDVAILNATHGSAATMLLAGKPVLHIPIFLEQGINADAVAKLGAGIAVMPNEPEKIAAGLQALLNLGQFGAAARAFAARYADFDPQRQIARMVERAERLVA